MRNGSLWSNKVFEKEVISHQNMKSSRPIKPFFGTWNQTNLCIKNVFFFHYSLATSMTNLSPNFHRFVILCIYASLNVNAWRHISYSKWGYGRTSATTCSDCARLWPRFGLALWRTSCINIKRGVCWDTTSKNNGLSTTNYLMCPVPLEL